MYTVILRVGYWEANFKFDEIGKAAEFMDTVFMAFAPTEDAQEVIVEMKKESK